MSELVLTIGNKNLSSWSMRPWLVLRHAGIPFRERVILFEEPGWRDTIGTFSPSGRVPVLEDGALKIWDSLAIAEYVAERHPDKELWPHDLADRAVARAVSAVRLLLPLLALATLARAGALLGAFGSSAGSSAVSLVAASEVWRALGASDRFGYDFNTTQAHCAASPSQVQSVNAFANRFLRDQNVNTNIANPPNAAGFNLNTDTVIDWETPTLQ